MSEKAREVLARALENARFAGIHAYGDSQTTDERVDKLLAALADAGLAVVPVEPIDEMLVAALPHVGEEYIIKYSGVARADPDLWREMLRAAPKP